MADGFAQPGADRAGAERARPHVTTYRLVHGPDEPDEATVSDLMTDLLHYAAIELGPDGLEGVLHRARVDFEGETP